MIDRANDMMRAAPVVDHSGRVSSVGRLIVAASILVAVVVALPFSTLGAFCAKETLPGPRNFVQATPSGGTLDGPWPIREILFLSSKIGLAAGGNLYTGVGGIYFSGDGGNKWSVDITTNAEMDACAVAHHGLAPSKSPCARRHHSHVVAKRAQRVPQAERRVCREIEHPRDTG